jgi:prefoldin subunit 1
MPDSRDVYRAVGRMFVKEELSVIKTILEKKVNDSTKEINALQKAALKNDGELKVRFHF